MPFFPRFLNHLKERHRVKKVKIKISPLLLIKVWLKDVA